LESEFKNNTEGSSLSEDLDYHNMKSVDHLNDICELLDINHLSEEFTKSLLTKVMLDRINKKYINIPLTKDQSQQARDSIAKFL